jgi:hypothetical protein
MSRSAEWLRLVAICRLARFLQMSAEKRLEVASFHILRIQLSTTLQAYIRIYSIRAK